MKKLSVLGLSLIILLTLSSCSFFGKKEGKKPKSEVSMAMEFAKKAKEKIKELKEEKKKEIRKENQENGKNIVLTDKDFEAYLESLNLAVKNLEEQNKKIEEKAKAGELSAMDILAFSMNSLATVFNPDEYLDKIAKNEEEKEHYQKAFGKIVEMYTYIKDKPVEQFKKESKENIEKAKKDAEEMQKKIEQLKKENPEAAKQLENQIDFKALQNVAEVTNPVNAFTENDFALYSKYQKEICAKNENLKNELKKLKTVFQHLQNK